MLEQLPPLIVTRKQRNFISGPLPNANSDSEIDVDCLLMSYGEETPRRRAVPANLPHEADFASLLIESSRPLHYSRESIFGRGRTGRVPSFHRTRDNRTLVSTRTRKYRRPTAIGRLWCMYVCTTYTYICECPLAAFCFSWLLLSLPEFRLCMARCISPSRPRRAPRGHPAELSASATAVPVTSRP